MNGYSIVNVILNGIVLLYALWMVVLFKKNKCSYKVFVQEHTKQYYWLIALACIALGYNLVITWMKLG